MDIQLSYDVINCLIILLLITVIILFVAMLRNKKATTKWKEAYASLNLANDEMTAICDKIGAIRWNMQYVVGGDITDVTIHSVAQGPDGKKKFSERKMKDLSSFFSGLSEEERTRIEDAVQAVINDPTGTVGLDVEYSHQDANHPITWFRAMGGSTISEDGKSGSFYGVFMNIDDRMRRQKAEHELATIDYLTHMLNRNAYELELARLSADSEELCSTYLGEIDINGLKAANDHIGHEAGDELIKATASILLQVFGKFGNCYRTGGDEFVVLFQSADDDQFRSMMNELQSLASAWKGQLNEKLTFSYGFVKGNEFEGKSIDELIKIADQRMYARKRAYYELSGVDRRNR